MRILRYFIATATIAMFLLTLPATHAYGQIQNNPFDRKSVNHENKIDILININGSYTIQLRNVDTRDLLEVYGILGKRELVQKINNSSQYVEISLPNGMFIIKVGKVTQKIVIK